ncbi:DUF2806 domain-containing protein [Sinorhizobium meliloti]|uniref:DUF2806 domain-containing protein n=1 Tax=Rhizobium meliloti TaxID=382 RepID=UPI0001E4D2AA|nr:DUF2806 domain-containing protein [Sinorhizobium meliloti]AEG04233.1 Protein of unknown function DUF2806 [Sinorhizobium meliloti BL225C]MDE4545173.1 DUF2806 domain-containing protein [Sinorhizobium meliloti]MDE4573804.1 DUF2806 domain-containing protein [Sinorhizobium meliloti]SDY98132.1 Protein of unknown function [Sinorhizobium meliloti]
MIEENGSKVPATWTDVVKSIAEGGLPQVIAGPAGKAISRLIAGATDIPAAWLEQKAQRIKDQTEARKNIMNAVAKASADVAVADPALLDRALERYIAEIYRRQENREEIAKRAVEQLAIEPPPHDVTEGPSDEWMDVFERDAANANSDRLKDLYSRILAGEIRHPGAFSLSTLRLITILDSHIARVFEEILPYVVDGRFLPRELVNAKVNYEAILELEAAGIVITGGGMMTLQKDLSPEGNCFFQLGQLGLATKFEGEGKKSFGAYTLTRPGAELATVSATRADLQAVIDYLWDQNPLEMKAGIIQYDAAGRKFLGNLAPVFRSDHSA